MQVITPIIATAIKEHHVILIPVYPRGTSSAKNIYTVKGSIKLHMIINVYNYTSVYNVYKYTHVCAHVLMLVGANGTC